MGIAWEQAVVRFVRGGGGFWHPDYAALDREWFRKNLIDHDLWYIWHGEGYLCDADGGTHTLRSGTCVWMRPGSVVEVWRKPGSKFGNRYFHFDLLDDKGRRVDAKCLADIPLTFDAANLPHFDATTRRMSDLIMQQPLMSDPATRVQVSHTIAAMLRSLLIDFALTSGLKMARHLHGIDEDHFKVALRLVSKINENPGHCDVESFVANSGYTMDHFRRLFKRVVGQTPHQVLIDARVNRAKVLLKETQLGVGEIADQLGYANVQYFSLQFKQAAGISPTAFREAQGC